MNALIVAYKPAYKVSNHFLSQIKREFNEKKAGFSGILDPFARGTLIVGLGNYTKLLPFLNIDSKVYRATLWLGAESKSLDIESNITLDSNILDSSLHKSLEELESTLLSFKGKIPFTPPIFSAKKINGVRSYELARSGKEIQLKEEIMQIFNIKLLNYSYPFIHFEVEVKKGAYIRSLGELIAKKLGFKSGILSSLERISEGKYKAESNKFLKLDPYKTLEIEELILDSSFKDKFFNGLKIKINKKDGIYKVKFDTFFSIIRIDSNRVSYLLNRIDIC